MKNLITTDLKLSLDATDEVAFKLAVKADGEQRHVISENSISNLGKSSTITKVFDISLKAGQKLDIMVIESSEAYKNSG